MFGWVKKQKKKTLCTYQTLFFAKRFFASIKNFYNRFFILSKRDLKKGHACFINKGQNAFFRSIIKKSQNNLYFYLKKIFLFFMKQ